MGDRPILFSGPMVRALLDGRKTQTRRIFVPPAPYAPHDDIGVEVAVGSIAPRIKAGDRLWVREAHYKTDDGDYERAVCAVDDDEVRDHLATIDRLKASHPQVDWGRHARLRPGIHMPRWASRLTLTVTDVRVQRLQDISEEDAEAEGYPSPEQRAKSGVAEIRDAYPIAWYSWLWDSINGAGSWEANPWVAAYSFTVERRNIDAER